MPWGVVLHVPRHKDHPLPDAEALRLALADSGVEDAPTEGDPAALQGLLFLAAHLVDRLKEVSFPDFAWSDPGFVATDAKTTIPLAYATLKDARDATQTLALRSPRLVALDARPSGLREFELAHLLYGRPTIYSKPHKPRKPRDDRIERAREAGWAKTLKDHNLLPGRGLAVHDEDQGLFLSDPDLETCPGVLVLLAGGDVHLWWNPFAKGGDSELQYWLQWGRGVAASEWKEMLRYEGED